MTTTINVPVGFSVGIDVGSDEVYVDGIMLKNVFGFAVGINEGSNVGLKVGSIVGLFDGFVDG